MKNLFILSIGIILLTGSCKIIAYKKHIQNMRISFGSGGGFTGAYTEYILNGKGTLSTIKPFTDSIIAIKTLDKKAFKTIFKTIESKSIQKITQNESGNMNTFIKLYNGTTIAKTYQWADGKTPPKEIAELYQSLINLTK